ncbi:unnamed protein product [marine sediment metagenome]|uniref:Uncharacterized protein n=1 Tax=marine sediment metagenome TaxID=412755 RepID=X1AAU0_9ZZZZ
MTEQIDSRNVAEAAVKSLGLLLLVAALVMGLGRSLMELSEWKQAKSAAATSSISSDQK